MARTEGYRLPGHNLKLFVAKSNPGRLGHDFFINKYRDLIRIYNPKFQYSTIPSFQVLENYVGLKDLLIIDT